jgi:hypothetical protein
MSAIKHDQEKPRVSLIPSEVILGIADVMTYGAKKYSDHNYTNGLDYTRLIDAAHRHLLAFQSGEDMDPESGKSHLLHCMATLGMLYYHTKHITDKDNRWEK